MARTRQSEEKHKTKAVTATASGRVSKAGSGSKGKKAAKEDRAARSPAKSNTASSKQDASSSKASQPKKPAELAADTNFFLMKTEPEDYTIEQLQKEKDQTTEWDGVRNYSARNIMRQMKKGAQAFFYKSNSKPPGIVGIMEVVREAHPDKTALQAGHKGHDPKSTEEDPRWDVVDVQLKRQFREPISLDELKNHKDGALSGLLLFKISRLSVQPLTKEEFEFILGLESSQQGS